MINNIENKPFENQYGILIDWKIEPLLTFNSYGFTEVRYVVTAQTKGGKYWYRKGFYSIVDAEKYTNTVRLSDKYGFKMLLSDLELDSAYL